MTQVDERQPELEVLLDKREDALELSAWGERFHLVQPRNLCFWVYVAVMVVGSYQIFSNFAGPSGYYGPAIAVGAVGNGLLGLAWWLWFRHIDRWEHQPWSIIVTGFLWGGIAATFGIAIAGNAALMDLYAKLLGQEWAGHWEAGLSAPFVEESAKFAGFLILMSLAPRLVRTVNDGLVLGAFIGLGFQIFEDTLYAVNGAQEDFGADQVGHALSTVWLRVATGFVSHPLFTALCCAGLIYLIGTPAQPRQVLRGLGFLGAGVLTHLAWDSMLAVSNSTAAAILWMVGTAVFGLGILIGAFRVAAPREHAFVRDILAPEVATGVLTEDEAEAVVDRRRRKAYVKAGGSRRERRQHRHVVDAARDLVDDLAVDKGTATERVAHARAEITRLRSG